MHISEVSSIEFNRDQVKTRESLEVFMSIKELTLFQPIFDTFIKDIKADDELDQDPDPFFERNGYLSLQEIINQANNEYLAFIIEEYLFIEFFDFFKKSSNSLYKIVSVLSCFFRQTDEIFIQCEYTK